jgi:selenocysteine lyase/cysteine desulfurase
VDFLSADAHKWMLGPLSIGIVYVKRRHFERLRPILVGASNVRSPDFVAQPEIVFLDTAARYEPGILNLGPLLGMKASLDLLLALGIPAVAGRIAGLIGHLASGLGELGFEPMVHPGAPQASGILTVKHPSADVTRLFQFLQARRITVSLRHDRAGDAYLRWSPHFYNTEAELDAAIRTVKAALG